MSSQGPRRLMSASHLFDGVAALATEGAVVVNGDRIEAVGPRAALLQQFGADNLTAEHFDGCTVMPGLIETHVHLILPANGDSFVEYCQNPDELLLLTAAHNASLCLQSGFTTVVDLGARGTIVFRLRDAIQKKILAGPRLLLVGRPLTITGGHCWPFLGEADGVDGVRHAVRQLCKEGADLIKVIVTGGGTPGSDSRRPAYSLPELCAAADEAHARNRKVFGHCSAIAGTTQALDAGFDLIAHCHFQTPDGRNEFDERLAHRIVEQGLYVNPTLQTNRVRGDARIIGRLPADAQRPAFEAWSARYAKITYNFSRLHQMGVRLICGSDSGWGWSAFGDNCLELDAMVAAGMSAPEALVSATSLAADALGWGDRIGRLEPGKSADLLVVAGDPTQNIRALKDVRAVWLEGQRVGAQPMLT
ncbi:MAG: amidohydrolase family protein [Chloroflexi bacterium]|nr:amidohydrolase family protein [Chloroflexota bacterium]